MRSSSVADSIARPGRTSAHSRLRANIDTGPLLPAAASACGCSMLADANRSARAPAAISSLSSPDAPYFACTSWRDSAWNDRTTSFKAERKLPAAYR
jgi:hypothetical protein